MTISWSTALLVGAWLGALACEEPDPNEPVDCAFYAFEEGGNEWEFEFVNNRAEPVYIEVDCRSLPVQIFDAQNNYVAIDGFGCECFCDELAQPGLASCFDCSADCLDYAWVQHLAPGATWSFSMAGIVLEQADPIPGACVDQELEVDYPCTQRRQAVPGDYAAKATISTTLTCSGGSECDCAPGDEGTCVTSGSLGERVELETTLSFPGSAVFSIE